MSSFVGRNIEESRAFCLLASVVLGLGLASMFYVACRGDDCLVMKAPSREHVEKHVWEGPDGCFKFSSVDVPCPDG